MKTCEYCGLDFSPKNKKKPNRFCSMSCRVSHNAIRGRDCAECMARFTPNDNRQKYCSRSCSARANNRLFPKRSGGRKGQSGVTYHTITCVQCGAIKRKHGDGHMDFCNQQCRGDYIFHQWKIYGVQHHNSWNVFPKILKRRLLEEAGYQCQAIRSDTGERCTESRRRPNGSSILEVEHKDGDSTNNAYDNIELLCPSCHSLTPTYRAGNWGKSTRTWRRVAKT